MPLAKLIDNYSQDNERRVATLGETMTLVACKKGYTGYEEYDLFSGKQVSFYEKQANDLRLKTLMEALAGDLSTLDGSIVKPTAIFRTETKLTVEYQQMGLPLDALSRYKRYKLNPVDKILRSKLKEGWNEVMIDSLNTLRHMHEKGFFCGFFDASCIIGVKVDQSWTSRLFTPFLAKTSDHSELIWMPKSNLYMKPIGKRDQQEDVLAAVVTTFRLMMIAEGAHEATKQFDIEFGKSKRVSTLRDKKAVAKTLVSEAVEKS